MFKGLHFPKSIVLTSVHWNLRFKLSYRDIEELMAERGVRVVSQYWIDLKTRGNPPVRRRRGPVLERAKSPADSARSPHYGSQGPSFAEVAIG